MGRARLGAVLGQGNGPQVWGQLCSCSLICAARSVPGTEQGRINPKPGPAPGQQA